MVYITEDLIRKRAEHNNCEISTLEELSLHQCDIEQIQHIDKWCRDLKILYLQHNLIPKIENLAKLKKLEYLNLALNNILDIENLEGCESLTKLDLTVNFVGKATSVEKLRCNEFLRELFLTGNPCSDYIGYRDFVIATLPQLEHLDGSEISRSERIEAMQSLSALRCDMLRQEKIYFDKLEKEKCNEKHEELNEGKPGFNKDWYTDTDGAHVERMEKTDERDDKEKKNDDFWNKPCKYTPESRIEMHRHMEEQRKEKENYKSAFPDPKPPKREVRFFNDDGKPFNINQANMDFTVKENEEEGLYVIDVACYKYLDTSLIDVDIQPLYVRVTIKGKVLQLVLMEEISIDRSTAQRSQTTGHLVLSLPKMKHVLEGKQNITRRETPLDESVEKCSVRDKDLNDPYYNKQKRETLEIGGSRSKIDIYNIVKDETVSKKSLDEILFSGRVKTPSGSNEIRDEALRNFVDDDDVPPLD